MKLTNTRQGFTLVEIMIVVAIIGLLASIAVPNFIRYRLSARRGVCIANLKQLQDAKATWAMEKGKKNGDAGPVEADLIGSTAYLRSKPVCPNSGQDYFLTIGNVDQRPTCIMSASEGHSL